MLSGKQFNNSSAGMRRSAVFACAALALFACVAAAAPAPAPPQPAAYQNRECLSCHSAPVKSEKLHRTIKPVLEAVFQATPHKKLTCVDCHSTARLAMKPKKHMTAIEPVDCRQCHFKGNKRGAPELDISKEYMRGIHGKQRIGKKNSDAPACKDCHGFHDIRPEKDPKSLVHRLRIYKTCGRCHGDHKLMKKYKLPDVYNRYRVSVHGRALLFKGLNVTAVCPDCHGAHDIRPPSDHASKMNRRHIPTSCGVCHEGIYNVYRRSIHGKEWAKGNKDVPVCTSCHGEHNIFAPESPKSTVNPANVGNTCGKCHEKMVLTRKYNIPINRLESFRKSFHGTALMLNNVTVANCASCHGYHDILPSSDPDSSVNPKNLPRTCGKCHPQARKNRNLGKVHVSPSPTSDRILFYVRLAYILLIAGSVAGFLFYIGVDIFGHVRRRRVGRKR